MGCFNENVKKWPEFKKLVESTGLSEDSVAVAYQNALDRGIENPSTNDILQYYGEGKTFFTTDESLPPFYREYATQLFNDAYEEDKKNAISVYGADNVFIYTKEDGTKIIKSAIPVTTKEQIETSLPRSTEDVSKIVLTQEQQHVVDNAVDFITDKLRTGSTKSGKRYLTIQGMAGTGKTTIVRNIIKELEKKGLYTNIAVAALSRKAVHVLSEKLSDAGVETETLYTLAGANPMQGEDKFAIDPNNAKFNKYNLIFVDEASMVGNRVMDAVDEYMDSNPNTVIVFLGDYGQIRPVQQEVGKSEKSLIFGRDDMQVENLTQRIRQGESSPILPFADRFWDISVGKSKGSVSSVGNKDAKTIITSNGALIFDSIASVFPKLIESFKKAVESRNVKKIKVVAATNNRVDTLNEKIHKALFPDASDVTVGDFIIFNEPYDTDIENSTEGVITNIKESAIFESKGVKYQLVSIKLTDDRTVSVKRIAKEDKESQKKHNENVQELLEKARSIPKSSSKERKMAWRAYYSELGKYANISYGYALTIHKAQGSTYDISVVDKDDIFGNGLWSNQEKAEIFYTALTRAKNVAVVLGKNGGGTEIASYEKISTDIDIANKPKEPTQDIIQQDNPIFLTTAVNAGVVVKEAKKPWKSDPNKVNDSVQLYVRGQENLGYFEVVKDFEDGYYSVHFKPTEADNPNAFSEEQKQLLFKAVADVIPNGSKLSTWGSLSKGGIAGLNRFSSLGFSVVGEREATMKGSGEQIRIPILQKSTTSSQDASVSSAVERALAAKIPTEKPEGNIVVKPEAVLTEIENLGRTTKTFKVSVTEGTSIESAIESIKSRINSGAIAVNSRLVPDTSSAAALLHSVKVLRGLRDYYVIMGNSFDSLNIDSFAFTEENLKMLLENRFQVKDGMLVVPTFTIGQSDFELARKAQRDILFTQGNFSDSALREYAKRAIFKLSETITRLINGEAKEIFGNSPEFKQYLEDGKGNPIDYTSMSRAEVLRRIGVDNALRLFVKEPIFNFKNNPLLKKNLLFAKRASVIYKNWDAFVELAYDTLNNLEEIALSDAKGKVVEYDNTQADIFSEGSGEEVLDQATEVELAELYGNTVEHWQVGFRQISAFHSLSTMIRNTVGRLAYLNPDGTVQYDEFGNPITLSSADAVSKILFWTQHCVDIDDMIKSLQSHVESEPWLRQLVGDYTDIYGTTQKGLLINPEKGQFQSQFFTNFKKYFQQYSVTYKNSKGNINIRAVNSQPFENEVLQTLETLLGENKLSVWNGKSLSSSYDKIKELLGTPYRRGKKGESDTPATGLFAFLKKASTGDVNDSDKKKAVSDIMEIYRNLDIPLPSSNEMQMLFTPDTIGTFVEALAYLMDAVKQAALIAGKNQNQFVLFAKSNEKIGNFDAVDARSNYKKLTALIAPAFAPSKEVVSYEGGKLYYAYVTPGYLGLLVDKLKGYTGEESYESFINREYLDYEGFFYKTKGTPSYGLEGHYNYILSRLMDEEDGKSLRELLEHVTSLTYQGVAYQDKPDAAYLASLIAMFFYDVHGKYSYYRIPILGGKPSEEYIKFERLGENYEEKIIDWLANRTFFQELNRIRAVQERNAKYLKENPDAEISNFDKNGLKFQYLPFLNERMEKGDAFGKLLKGIVEGTLKKNPFDMETVKGQTFKSDLKEAIRQGINEKFNEFLSEAEDIGFITRNDSGEILSVFQVENLFNTKYIDYRDALKEYFFSDFFASVNILQLTIGDIAMYKNAEDLQKRLAQLHSPGMRLNIKAKDIATGEAVSDGNTRYVILKDAYVTSDIVANLKVAYNNLGKQQAPGVNLLRKKILELIKKFEDGRAINWADAQAFSSPTSYRKKMHLAGKWDKRQEEAYQRIIRGEFSDVDLDIVWQPLKPFTYAQISKDSGSKYMPKIKMGVQNKDSEYLLLMADALMRAGGVTDSALGAIFTVMEKSQGSWVKDASGEVKYIPNGKGIDTFMFESAVKAGATGIIDLNGMSASEIVETLWTGKNGKKGILRTNSGYNDIYVHTVPFENYTIQQEVPAHFKGKQQMGSQIRCHTIADLSDKVYKVIDGVGQLVDNTVTIKEDYVDDNGKFQTRNRTLTVAKLKAEYQNLVAENIKLSFDELVEELGLNIDNHKLRNIILSKKLREAILEDGRFGSDMLWAVDVNSEGEFNIPLSDPIHSGQMQQLLNSIIKNRINKQEVLGGAVVQVTSWGVNQNSELGIRFRSQPDENGNYKLLLTRKEFNAVKEGKPFKKVHTNGNRFILADNYENYEDYVKENQYSVAYFEAFAPIYSDDLLKFVDKNGNIDVGRIERANPKLLEMIGYRIPTEGKYSAVPIKIVGFLPRNAGEAIALPADITLLTGSDFDVDKLYIMRRAFKFAHQKKNNDVITDLVTTNVGNKRDDNNNRLIDLTWGILTSPTTAGQLFSPGNFDEPKRVGYLISAYERTGESLEKLSKLSIDELKNKSYENVSLLFAQTQVKFHGQNSVASKLIGVFAQANVSHGFITLMNNPSIRVESGFKLNGMDIYGDVPIDNIMSKDPSTRISENLASLLAASVDAVKDPVLNLSNFNMTTINMAVTLIRLGFSIETIGWFLTTPIMKDLVKRYSLENIDGKKSLERVITEMMKELRERNNNTLVFVPSFDMTEDDFKAWHFRSEEAVNKAKEHYVNDFDFTIENTNDMALANGEEGDPVDVENEVEYQIDSQDAIDYQLLGLASRLLGISKEFRSITHMTRYNSISSSVGPFIANTMVSKASDSRFLLSDSIGNNYEKGTHMANDPYTMTQFRMNSFKKQILTNPILASFRGYSYKLESLILGENFIQSGEIGRNVFAIATSYFDELSKSTALKLSEFIMSYVVNSGNPVFDLTDGDDITTSRRALILKNTPIDIAEARKTYPDNAFLKAIHNSRVEGGPTKLSINTRGLDETTVQDIKTGWKQLYDSEVKNGHVAPEDNLAIKIIEYNFFVGGFGFSPNTFMRLVPANLKQYIPNYLDNIANPFRGIDYYNLIEQFLVNYGITNQSDVYASTLEEELPEGTDVNDDKPHEISEHILSPGLVRVWLSDDREDGFVYAIVRRGENGKVVFRTIDKLGGYDNEGFEINPALRVDEMHSIYSSEIQGVTVSEDGFKELTPRGVFNLQSFINAVFNLMNPEEKKTFSRKATNFSDKMMYIRSVANKRISDEEGSDDFKLIKKILNNLNLSEVTRESLEKTLDENNICR